MQLGPVAFGPEFAHYAFGSGNSVSSLTGALRVGQQAGSRRLYAIAGLGGYSWRGALSANLLEVSPGAGVEFGSAARARAFGVEVRLHANVQHDGAAVPTILTVLAGATVRF